MSPSGTRIVKATLTSSFEAAKRGEATHGERPTPHGGTRYAYTQRNPVGPVALELERSRQLRRPHDIFVITSHIQLQLVVSERRREDSKADPQANALLRAARLVQR